GSRTTEQDVRLTGLSVSVIAPRGADDQVVKAIAVDVAGSGHAAAETIASEIATDQESLRRCQNREIDHLPTGAVGRAEAARRAEQDISFAAAGAAIVAQRRTDNDVTEAIAIDVTRRRYAVAGLVGGDITADNEAL